jgi:hypothetical protein
MQTTIADFVISNPANITAENLGSSDPTLARQAFQSRVTYDSIESAATPTLVYIKNNQIIAWYEKDAMVGFI